MIRIKTIAAVALLCLVAGSAGAMTKEEIDAKWNELVAAQDLRIAGSQKAAELKAELDSQILDEPLYTLWQRMTAKGSTERLRAAWSILNVCVPDGDVSRWDEVKNFELPSETPRAFMVIDALYVALIDLPKNDGGEWLAAGLLKAFSRSSHGRFDFLTVCPEPVAEAVEKIVSSTHIIGQWKPRLVIGKLPIARPVDGYVTQSGAINENMQFLDGAGLPAGNGFYAWDRRTGRIYRISMNDGEQWDADN